MPAITETAALKLTAAQENLKLSPIMVNELIADEALCRSIAGAFPDIERVILQLILDTVTEENKDVVGPVMLGLRRTLNTFYVISVKAAATPNRNS